MFGEFVFFTILLIFAEVICINNNVNPDYFPSKLLNMLANNVIMLLKEFTQNNKEKNNGWFGNFFNKLKTN